MIEQVKENAKLEIEKVVEQADKEIKLLESSNAVNKEDIKISILEERDKALSEINAKSSKKIEEYKKTVELHKQEKLSRSEIKSIKRKAEIKKLLENFDPANFHSDLGDVQEISELIEKYIKTPGAADGDTCIIRLIEDGAKANPNDKINRAKGALFELISADRLDKRGKRVISFHFIFYPNEELSKKLGKDLVEFDIELDDMVVEAKNTVWKEFSEIKEIERVKELELDNLSKLSKLDSKSLLEMIGEITEKERKKMIEVHKCLKQFLAQQEVEPLIGKQFWIISNHYLEPGLRKWLQENDFKFEEGWCNGCSSCFHNRS